MIKIIFLDIDGVLNSELYHESDRYVPCKEEDAADWFKRSIEDLDPKAIGFLNNLIASTEAKVVISSTWRRSSTVQELQQLFEARGFKGEIIGSTPVLSSQTSVRGNEIINWIIKNSDLVGYYAHFRNYVILDDDSDMLYWQKDNFILVDGYVGLTPNNCYKAIRILNSVISGEV